MKCGISSRHGAHHVAQKFTTTTLPRHWPMDCSLPLVSGKDSASNAEASVAVWCSKPTYAPSAKAIAPAIPTNSCMDNFFTWIRPPGGCERSPRDGEFQLNHPLRGVSSGRVGATFAAGKATVTRCTWTG